MQLSFNLRSAVLALCALGVAAPADAGGDFIGLDSATSKLYDLDTAASTTTLIGSITGGPAFGFGAMDRAPNDTLYAVAPGAVSGYSIYTIDESTLTAAKKFTISGNSAGTIGIAVEPSGNAVWVAGFVGFSLNVKIQRIDLTTGVKTEHGLYTGNCWGLAFDGGGDLFTTQQGMVGPELVKIDQTDAANSVVVGTDMLSVDMNFGVDLASAYKTVGLTLYSRATGTIFSIDTSTGIETVLGNPGVSNVFTIAPNDPCPGQTTEYGLGCPGTGNFTPVLSVGGCPAVGQYFSIDVAGGLGGSSAILLVGLGQTNLPVGAGCSLLVSPLTPVTLTVPLSPGGPGAGGISIPVLAGPSFAGISFTLQAWVIDPATGIGGAGSNGVAVSIP